jgi:Glycosyl hydrolase family 26
VPPSSSYSREARTLHRKALALTIMLSLGIPLSSCGSSTTPAPAPHPGNSIVALQRSGPVALGVNTADAPSQSPLAEFTKLAGRQPKIVMWYQNWKEPLFYQSQLEPLTRRGLIPMINWHPQGGRSTNYSLRAIAEGNFDSYLRASARMAKRWHRPMFIDLAQEMNLPGYAWSEGVNGNTPELYVRAWRHVVDIFRVEGADNVRWVWAPNVDCNGHCPFGRFYPGNSWVDWVGLDGYNQASVDDVQWRSFAQVFGHSYDVLRSLTKKPVMIAETASTEQGGSKSQWILEMGRSLPKRFPAVRILVWFDRLKETNWTINSSPSSLAAFRAVMRRAPFAERPSP